MGVLAGPFKIIGNHGIQFDFCEVDQKQNG